MEVSKLNNHKKHENGFTLLEVLMSLAIVSFVVVSILSGFAQRMHSDRNTNLRNIAITLAEARMEEFLKFPSSQLTTAFPPATTDFIVYRGGRAPKVTTADPGLEKQFRRTVTLAANGDLCRVQVVVEYGYLIRTHSYPFRVALTTQRGL